MTNALCVLNNQGYKHELRICNIYCFSTATMVTLTSLNAMFISTLPALHGTIPAFVCRIREKQRKHNSALPAWGPSTLPNTKSVCYQHCPIAGCSNKMKHQLLSRFFGPEVVGGSCGLRTLHKELPRGYLYRVVRQTEGYTSHLERQSGSPSCLTTRRNL
jgi:hypothetical protein